MRYNLFAISYKSRSKLVFLERNMNSHDNIHVLESIAIPNLMKQTLFQQDNATSLNNKIH